MGCGKSSIGRKLAKKTEREFVDMDRYIEERKNGENKPDSAKSIGLSNLIIDKWLRNSETNALV